MSNQNINKGYLQRVSRFNAKCEAKYLYEKEVKEQIIVAAQTGGEQFKIRSEEYKPYMKNPNFKRTLEELSGVDVYIYFDNPRKLYSGSILVNKEDQYEPESCYIIFDWSED